MAPAGLNPGPERTNRRFVSVGRFPLLANVILIQKIGESKVSVRRPTGGKGAMDGARQDGRQEERLEVARNFKRMGIPIPQIAQGTGLSIEDIAKL
jgi:hypothetical protein